MPTSVASGVADNFCVLWKIEIDTMHARVTRAKIGRKSLKNWDV
jgi:hypothetical protein